MDISIAIASAWSLLKEISLGIGANELHRQLVERFQRAGAADLDLQKALYASLLDAVDSLSKALSAENHPYFVATPDLNERRDKRQRVQEIFKEIRAHFPKISALQSPVTLILEDSSSIQVRALLTRVGLEFHFESLPESLRNAFESNLPFAMLAHFRQQVATDDRLHALLQLDLTTTGFQAVQRELRAISDFLHQQCGSDDPVKIQFWTENLASDLKNFMAGEFKDIKEQLNFLERKIDRISEPLLEKGSGIQDVVQGIEKILEQQRNLTALIKRGNLVNISTERSVALEASSNKEQLDEIKKLVDDGKILTARQKAIKLKSEIERNNADEAESLFLLCTYIAESFIASPGEEKNAIPYLKHAHAIMPNEERGLRCLAAAHFFDNKPKEGLDAINKALEINPHKAEGINIKAHLLIELGRNEEVSQLFTEENLAQSTSLPHIYLAKAVASRLMGKHDEAIIAAEKAIELSTLKEADTLILVAETLLGKLDHLRNQNHGRLDLNKYQIEFDKASRIIDEAIDLLNPERKKRVGQLHAMRGSLHFWTGYYVLAEEDFQKALQHEFESAEVFKNYALSLSMQEKYQEAANNFIKAKELGLPEQEFVGLLFELYLLHGDPGKAIKVLEESLNSPTITENEKIELQAYLVIAHDNDFKTQKASELLATLEVNHGNHPNVLLAKGMHNKLLGQTDAALECFNKGLVVSSGYLNTQFRATIADILYEKKDPESMRQAAVLYGEIADILRCDHLLQRLASALYHTRQYVECLELCKKVSEIHGFVDFTAEVEAGIYYKTNNFAIASDLLKALSTRYRGNPNYLINYAFCLFRLGRKEEAHDVVLQAENMVGKKSDDLVFLAVAYEAVGKLEKALELSLRALEEDPTKLELHLHFIFLFVRAENSLPTIDGKYKHTYQNCIAKLEERFPGQREIELLKLPEKPEEFRQQLLMLLQEASQQRVKVETLYQQKRLPLGFLARSVGRDIITTWGALTEHPYLKIWASSGITNEIADEIQCVRTAKSIVIDPIALLTIKALDFLPKLADAFEKIFVPQSIIDQVQLKIRFEKIAAEKGHWVINEEDGKIIWHHMPSEILKRNIEALESLLNWVTKNSKKVQIIGKSIERTEKDEYKRFKQLEDVLGAEFSEVLLESHVRAIPMYSEDFRLRQLGKNDLNIKSFGTQALLKAFLDKKLISTMDYNQALITLLALNYHFISISTETIIQNLQSNDYVTKPRTLLPFEILKHPDNDLSRLIKIATEFLLWLWNSDLHLMNKQSWTDVMLSSVISNRHGMITGSIWSIEKSVSAHLTEFNNRDFKVTVKIFKRFFGGSLI